MFKTTLKLACASFAMTATLVMAQNAAVVNGKSIPSEMLDEIMKQQAKNGQAPSAEARAQIRQQLINFEVLRQEAVKKGLAERKEVKIQMQLQQSGILVSALRDDFMNSNKLSDAEVQEQYKKIASMMTGKEYNASHILVEKEDKAKEIISKLEKGAKFEDLAKAESQDPGSKTNGGDLDWAKAEDYVPEFSQGMVGLQKGQVTKAPVKSQFGYHVIRLNDVRDTQAPPLDQVRPQLEQKMIGEKWDQYVKGLIDAAKIK